MPGLGLPEPAPELAPDFVRALDDIDERAVALFDADGTLYRGDAADDLTQWLIAGEQTSPDVSWAEYTRIYRENPAAGCRYLLGFYAGLPYENLCRLVREFWHEHSVRHWIPEVVAAISWFAKQKATIWVVTGSSTVSMLPLLEVLPIDRILGMDLKLDKNRVVTGRLDGILCTDEGKAQKCRANLNAEQRVVFAAGNGSLDAAMMELATDVSWAVYPDPEFERRARARGWHVSPRPADFVEEEKLA